MIRVGRMFGARRAVGPIAGFALLLSAGALAAVEGTWKGTAYTNLGVRSQCTATMDFELKAGDGKLGETFTVTNPLACGYGDIPLKN